MTSVRVLHVDDEPDIREVVEISLGLDPNFVTRSCDLGQEALTVVAEWAPDIILLDVMMPVMDGPATLAQLRERQRTANIPVVFMTARAQARELDIFRALGAVGVIPKPFDPMTLAASVRAYLTPEHDKFATLRKVFVQRANDDAKTLLAHRSALANELASPATLAEIGNMAHRLAGSSGIYGFPGIGDAAAELEALILEGSQPVESLASALDRLLVCIGADCSDGAEQPHSQLDA